MAAAPPGRRAALSYTRRARPPTPGCAARAYRPCIGLPSRPLQETPVLRYAVIFFLIAIVAAVLGFGGIAAGAVGIAKLLFLLFIVLAVVTAVVGLIRSGR